VREQLIAARNRGAAVLLISADLEEILQLSDRIAVMFSGNNPLEAYIALVRGAFGSGQRISETMVRFIPLTIMALGTSIAFKAQLWNIGGDGQFIFGSVFAILPGLFLPLPPFLLMPVSLVCGMAGGALWAGIAGVIRVKFEGNEVISTLMLNYIAAFFLSYLVNGPMMDPAGFKFPQSPLVAEALRLPLFAAPMRLHAGLFVMLALTLLMVFFWRTSLGFQIDLVGQGQTVSRYAGVNVSGVTMLSMLLSGALIGLAGWTETYGVQYRLLEGLASGYGNLAVVIALLGSLSPVGIFVASFFFSALMTGGATIQRMSSIPY
jgi:simple sugar transport system permease protein